VKSAVKDDGFCLEPEGKTVYNVSVMVFLGSFESKE